MLQFYLKSNSSSHWLEIVVYDKLGRRGNETDLEPRGTMSINRSTGQIGINR